MTYILNGVTILQPSRGQWVPRRGLDLSGEGRTIYAPAREFRLQWALMPIDDFAEVYDAWELTQATGTTVVELPDILSTSYEFREFSGCHVEEPTMGEYYQEHVRNVVLVITNINV